MPQRNSLSIAVGLAMLTMATGVTAAPIIPPITDPPTNQHNPGRFVWADLFTSDPAASTAYYCRLFGWNARPIEDGGRTYTLLSAGSRPVAGIARGPQPAENRPSARWIHYISVPDVDAASSSAIAQGGRAVIGPATVPDRGRVAILADSEGALFGVMHSPAGDPDDFLADPGEWIWTVLNARDPRKVLPLYEAVAGYQVFDDTRTGIEGDYILGAGGFARGGVLPASAESRNPSTWFGFVRVEDLGKTIDNAIALGGTLLLRRDGVHAGIDAAVMTDPLGCVFGAITYSTNEEETTP